MSIELGPARAALALGLRLTGARNLCGPADHGGDADPVAGRRSPAREASIDGIQDTDTQVVTLGAGHGCLPEERQGITPTPPRKGPPHDSKNPETALDRLSHRVV
jgi:hypothetical protein